MAETDRREGSEAEADEDLLAILFAGRPPVPLLEVSEAAELIADAGLPRETAATQIRRYAQLGYLLVRGHRRSGPTAANLFGPTELVTAKLLSTLTDLGIADRATLAAVATELRPAARVRPGRDALSAAALGMVAWQRGLQEPTAPDPASAAIIGTLRHGQDWEFRLDLLRGERTGERRVQAIVYDAAGGPPPAGGGGGPDAEVLTPRASVTIPLSPLIRRIFAARMGKP